MFTVGLIALHLGLSAIGVIDIVIAIALVAFTAIIGGIKGVADYEAKKPK